MIRLSFSACIMALGLLALTTNPVAAQYLPLPNPTIIASAPDAPDILEGDWSASNVFEADLDTCTSCDSTPSNGIADHIDFMNQTPGSAAVNLGNTHNFPFGASLEYATTNDGAGGTLTEPDAFIEFDFGPTPPLISAWSFWDRAHTSDGVGQASLTFSADTTFDMNDATEIFATPHSPSIESIQNRLIIDSPQALRYVRFKTGTPAGGFDGAGEIRFYTTDPTAATMSTWNQAGGGSWNQSSNWSGSVPDSDRVQVTFGDAIAATGTVFTDQDVTVHSVTFVNPIRYILAGGGTVTLSGNTSVTSASLTTLLGDHEVQAPVALASDTSASVSTGTSLTFNNSLDLGGNTLTKTGGGTLTVNGPLTTGTGGTVDCLAGTCNGTGTVVGNLINGSIVAPGGGDVTVVPEPSSWMIFLLGVLGLTLARRASEGERAHGRERTQRCRAIWQRARRSGYSFPSPSLARRASVDKRATSKLARRVSVSGVGTLTLILLSSLLVSPIHAAIVGDVQADFQMLENDDWESMAVNPNGNWTYGNFSGPDSSFVAQQNALLFTATDTGGPLQIWEHSVGVLDPNLAYNGNDVEVISSIAIQWDPGELSLGPSGGGSAARWTAPSNYGSLQISGSFTENQNGGPTAVSVLHNDASIFDQTVIAVDEVAPFNLLLANITAGDTFDFAVLTGSHASLIATLDADVDLGASTWNQTAGGDWNAIGNWTGLVPNSDAAEVTFGDKITATSTVFTDQDVTVHNVTFANPNRYVVAGGGTITLTGNSSVATASLSTLIGDHEFQAPIALASDTGASISAGTTLSFNNSLNLAGNTLTKTGGGTLALNNNIVTGTGGTIQCNSGICGGSGTVNGDLSNNGVVAPGSSAGAQLVAATVPEPSTLLLLSVASLLFYRCRWQRRERF